jgi:hypothetical protein
VGILDEMLILAGVVCARATLSTVQSGFRKLLDGKNRLQEPGLKHSPDTACVFG